MEVGVKETWAYIKIQLDFPKYKRRRVHIITGQKTLCGTPVIGESWETVYFTEGDWNTHPWACKKCRLINDKEL